MFVKNMESPARLSLLVLMLLLSLQLSVFSNPPWPGRTGDEFRYTSKAKYLLEHGKLPRAEGKGDWRPVGYPVFLALCRSLASDWLGARALCAVVQFSLIAFVLLIFQCLACSALRKSYWLFLIAITLGAQPWTFEDCRNMLPDSLTASLTTLGILGLFGFVVKQGVIQNIFFFFSCLTLCATMFLRPEMIVMAPVLIGGALFLKQESRSILFRYSVYGAMLFFACLLLQVFYRNLSTGDLLPYGRFSLHKRGAHNWVNSWFSTEQNAYNRFLHGGKILNTSVDAFPKRAFADEFERIEIQKALDLARTKGVYDEQVDRLFQSVADKRLRDNFFVNAVLTRIWRTGMLWFNFERNNRLTMMLGPAIWTGKAVVYASYVMRISLFLLAGYALFSALRNFRNRTALWYHRLTALMFLCVLTRTLLIGMVLGWMIDRYALVAWPAMLWCAAAGMIDLAGSTGMEKTEKK